MVNEFEVLIDTNMSLLREIYHFVRKQTVRARLDFLVAIMQMLLHAVSAETRLDVPEADRNVIIYRLQGELTLTEDAV